MTQYRSKGKDFETFKRMNGPEDKAESLSSDTDDECYEVEAILEKDVNKRGKVKYFVKWERWPSSANTWEPLENLTNCQEKIDEYERKVLEKKSKKKLKKVKKCDNMDDLRNTFFGPSGDECSDDDSTSTIEIVKPAVREKPCPKSKKSAKQSSSNSTPTIETVKPPAKGKACPKSKKPKQPSISDSTSTVETVKPPVREKACPKSKKNKKPLTSDSTLAMETAKLSVREKACPKSKKHRSERESKNQMVLRPSTFNFEHDDSLVAEKIVGIDNGPFELVFLMKYKGRPYDDSEIIPAAICNMLWPELVIKFYEKFSQFKRICD